jgi:hypothetical protein
MLIAAFCRTFAKGLPGNRSLLKASTEAKEIAFRYPRKSLSRVVLRGVAQKSATGRSIRLVGFRGNTSDDSRGSVESPLVTEM